MPGRNCHIHCLASEREQMAVSLGMAAIAVKGICGARFAVFKRVIAGYARGIDVVSGRSVIMGLEHRVLVYTRHY